MRRSSLPVRAPPPGDGAVQLNATQIARGHAPDAARLFPEVVLSKLPGAPPDRVGDAVELEVVPNLRRLRRVTVADVIACGDDVEEQPHRSPSSPVSDRSCAT